MPIPSHLTKLEIIGEGTFGYVQSIVTRRTRALHPSQCGQQGQVSANRHPLRFEVDELAGASSWDGKNTYSNLPFSFVLTSTEDTDGREKGGDRSSDFDSLAHSPVA